MNIADMGVVLCHEAPAIERLAAHDMHILLHMHLGLSGDRTPDLLECSCLVALPVGAPDALAGNTPLCPLQALVIHQLPCHMIC